MKRRQHQLAISVLPCNALPQLHQDAHCTMHTAHSTYTSTQTVNATVNARVDVAQHATVDLQ